MALKITISQEEMKSLYWENVGDKVKTTKGSAAALKAYETALKFLPDPPPKRRCYLEHNIALGYVEKKEFPAALIHYLIAWEHRTKASNQGVLAGDMGDCYFLNKDFSQAIQFYREKIALLDPHDPTQEKSLIITQYNLAKAQIKSNHFREAIPALKAALLYYEKNVFSPDQQLMDICNQMGLCFELDRQIKESILFAQQAFGHCPPDQLPAKAFILFTLARRHRLLENYEEAWNYSQAARALESSVPKDDHVWAQLYMIEGDCLKYRNDLAKARKAYESAARRFQEIKKLSMLGSVDKRVGDCFVCERNYQDALIAYQSAYENTQRYEPQKIVGLIDILESIGKTQAALNQHTEALDTYRKAWRLVKESNALSSDRVRDILIPLALSYYNLGQIKQAKIWWHIASLTLEINFSEDEKLKLALQLIYDRIFRANEQSH